MKSHMQNVEHDVVEPPTHINPMGGDAHEWHILWVGP